MVLKILLLMVGIPDIGFVAVEDTFDAIARIVARFRRNILDIIIHRTLKSMFLCLNRIILV